MDIKNTKRTDIKIGDWIKVTYNQFDENTMNDKPVIRSGIVDFIDRLEFCDDYGFNCEETHERISVPDYCILEVKHN